MKACRASDVFCSSSALVSALFASHSSMSLTTFFTASTSAWSFFFVSAVLTMFCRIVLYSPSFTALESGDGLEVGRARAGKRVAHEGVEREDRCAGVDLADAVLDAGAGIEPLGRQPGGWEQAELRALGGDAGEDVLDVLGRLVD